MQIFACLGDHGELTAPEMATLAESPRASVAGMKSWYPYPPMEASWVGYISSTATPYRGRVTDVGVPPLRTSCMGLGSGTVWGMAS